jgi:hypothetical protein
VTRKKQRVGYWTKHPGEFHKRTKPEGETFCGWDILEGQISEARQSHPDLGIVLGGLVSALFETGGRATEVLGLRERQFIFPEDLSNLERPEIHIADMVVLKKPVLTYRQVSFPAIERLAKSLIGYVKLVRDRSDILPDRIRRNENGLLFPYKYNWLYKHITRLFGGTKEERATNQGWWPHRYRAERATQLVVEYDFDTYRLLRFFGWNSAEITLRYVRLSTLDVLDRMWRGLM